MNTPKATTVDEVISQLPRAEAVIVRRLRSLVLECLPKAAEKVSYGVPFYTRHRMICFIWPPSLNWGKQQYTLENKGVTLGFCQGNRMANEDGLLLAEGRKQVLCVYYKSVKEIEEDQVRAWLFEAELIDETFARAKQRPAKGKKQKSSFR
jgi:hypothetical protein